jgi:hypothetical protein
MPTLPNPLSGRGKNVNFDLKINTTNNSTSNTPRTQSASSDDTFFNSIESNINDR